MNKTVSINLGGFFFHIDEDAYQKLNRYFDAIKRSLSPDGKEEIMSDIEGRISELLSEKLMSEKQVVGIKEIDEVIAVMGQPEDYKIDEDGSENKQQTYYTPNYDLPPTRKFYRDGDRNIIAGVCAGVAHYFRIDPLWIRIIFVITLFISFGTTLFVYILLWILIPKAITTTEKLEMTGEPINISNIEKKVKEEIDNISSKLHNVDYDRLGANAKSGAEKIGSGIGNVFMAIFKGIAKVLGALITVTAAVALGSLIITFFVMLFTSGLNDAPFFDYANWLNHTDAPTWVVALLGLLVFGIPVFFLFLLGLKILVENMRPVGNITKYTFLAIWLVAIAFSIYLSVKEAHEFANDGKVMKTEQINLAPNKDTLYIKFRYNDYFTKSVEHNTPYRITEDSIGNEIIYSNEVELHFMKTDEKAPYLQVEKFSHGNSISEAKKRAEKINYKYELQGNKLTLDNYFTADTESKFRRQRVKIYIYLPEGTFVHADRSVSHFHRSEYNELDIPYSDENHLFKVQAEEGLKCLDCPEEVNEGDGDEATIVLRDGNDSIVISSDSIHHDENVDVNINVDKNGVRFKATTKKDKN